MDLVIWKLLRCLLNNYQIVTFDILAGEAGFEPTSTVLETAELPLFYSPVVRTEIHGHPSCMLKNYSSILITWPAPTVRPPSRIANWGPSLRATGVMS